MYNFSKNISLLDKLFGPKEMRQGGKVLDCGCSGIKPVAFAQKGGYVVKRGDNLSKISKQFGVSVNDIAQANNIKDINKIYAGQELSIVAKINDK